jgi:hypothetical protein
MPSGMATNRRMYQETRLRDAASNERRPAILSGALIQSMVSSNVLELTGARQRVQVEWLGDSHKEAWYFSCTSSFENAAAKTSLGCIAPLRRAAKIRSIFSAGRVCPFNATATLVISVRRARNLCNCSRLKPIECAAAISAAIFAGNPVPTSTLKRRSNCSKYSDSSITWPNV